MAIMLRNIQHISLFDKQTDIFICDINAQKCRHRETEKQAEKELLEYIFSEPTELRHTADGKPYLTKPINISISHSNHKLCIAVSKELSIGVDIEEMHPRLERVKEKFLPSQLRSENLELNTLAVYWSAIEAIYKIAGEQAGAIGENIIFSSNIKGELHENIVAMVNDKQFKAEVIELTNEYEIVVAWEYII